MNTGVAMYTAVASHAASAAARSPHDGTPYGSAFAGSRVTIPASRLRGSARIAGSTRLRVISPTPTTRQESIGGWYRGALARRSSQPVMGRGLSVRLSVCRVPTPRDALWSTAGKRPDESGRGRHECRRHMRGSYAPVIPALESVLIMMLVGSVAALCVPDAWKAARI